MMTIDLYDTFANANSQQCHTIKYILSLGVQNAQSITVMEVHDSTSVCLSSTAHRPPLLTLLVALCHRRRRRLLHLVLFQHVVQGDGSVERKSSSIEFQSPFFTHYSAIRIL